MNFYRGKIKIWDLRFWDKTTVNVEDLDVDFGLQHFKLRLFVNEGDEETNS